MPGWILHRLKQMHVNEMAGLAGLCAVGVCETPDAIGLQDHLYAVVVPQDCINTVGNELTGEWWLLAPTFDTLLPGHNLQRKTETFYVAIPLVVGGGGMLRLGHYRWPAGGQNA